MSTLRNDINFPVGEFCFRRFLEDYAANMTEEQSGKSVSEVIRDFNRAAGKIVLPDDIKSSFNNPARRDYGLEVYRKF